MNDDRIKRLKELKNELETSRLPAAMLVDKFKEAVLLTVAITVDLAEGRA